MRVCVNDDNNNVRSFMTSVFNPCCCGGNIYSYIDYGNKIFGICSACGEVIYEIKPEYMEEYRTKYRWHERENNNYSNKENNDVTDISRDKKDTQERGK